MLCLPGDAGMLSAVVSLVGSEVGSGGKSSSAVTHGGRGRWRPRGEPVCIHNSLRLTHGASLMLG